MERPESGIHWPAFDALFASLSAQGIPYRPLKSPCPVRTVERVDTLLPMLLEPGAVPSSLCLPPQSKRETRVHRFCDAVHGPELYGPVSPPDADTSISIFNPSRLSTLDCQVSTIGTLRSAWMRLYLATGFFTLTTPFLSVSGDLIPDTGTWQSAVRGRAIFRPGAMRIDTEDGVSHPVRARVEEVSVLQTTSDVPIETGISGLYFTRGDDSVHRVLGVASGVFDLSPRCPLAVVDVARGTGFVQCEGYTVAIALSFGRRCHGDEKERVTGRVANTWTDVDPNNGAVYDGEVPVRQMRISFAQSQVTIVYEDGTSTRSSLLVSVTGVSFSQENALRMSETQGMHARSAGATIKAKFETAHRKRTFTKAFISEDAAHIILSNPQGELALGEFVVTG